VEVLTALSANLCSPYYTLLCHSLFLEHSMHVYLIHLCWVICVSQVIESVESSIELLLLCCLSLAIVLPNSRQQ